MNISIQNRNLINQTYGKSRTPAASSNDGKSAGKAQESTRNIDSVSLSSATKDLQKIEQAMPWHAHFSLLSRLEHPG